MAEAGGVNERVRERFCSALAARLASLGGVLPSVARRAVGMVVPDSPARLVWLSDSLHAPEDWRLTVAEDADGILSYVLFSGGELVLACGAEDLEGSRGRLDASVAFVRDLDGAPDGLVHLLETGMGSEGIF